MLLRKVEKTLEQISEFGRLIDEKRKELLVEFEDVIKSEGIDVATVDPNYMFAPTSDAFFSGPRVVSII